MARTQCLKQRPGAETFRMEPVRFRTTPIERASTSSWSASTPRRGRSCGPDDAQISLRDQLAGSAEPRGPLAEEVGRDREGNPSWDDQGRVPRGCLRILHELLPPARLGDRVGASSQRAKWIVTFEATTILLCAATFARGSNTIELSPSELSLTRPGRRRR